MAINAVATANKTAREVQVLDLRYLMAGISDIAIETTWEPLRAQDPSHWEAALGTLIGLS